MCQAPGKPVILVGVFSQGHIYHMQLCSPAIQDIETTFVCFWKLHTFYRILHYNFCIKNQLEILSKNSNKRYIIFQTRYNHELIQVK